MRKLLIPVLAALAAIAVAGIAYAANVYTVDGDTSPHGKGSAAKPLPCLSISTTRLRTLIPPTAASR